MSTPSATTDKRIPGLTFPKQLHQPISCSKCKTIFSLPPTSQWACPKCDVKVWQPYDFAKNCAVCADALGVGNRNHCHRCGCCVCKDCGQYQMFISGKDKDRVCKGCAFPPIQDDIGDGSGQKVNTTTISGFLTKVSKDPKTGKEVSRNIRYFELRYNVLMYTDDRNTVWKNFFVLDGAVISPLEQDKTSGFTISLRQGFHNPCLANHGPLHLIADKQSDAEKWVSAIEQVAAQNSGYFIDENMRKQSARDALSGNSTASNNNNALPENNLNTTQTLNSTTAMLAQTNTALHRFDKDPKNAPPCAMEGMLVKIGAKAAGSRNPRHFRLFYSYLQYATEDRKKMPEPKDEYDVLGAEITSTKEGVPPNEYGIKIDKGPKMKRCPLILLADSQLNQTKWILALQAAAMGDGPMDEGAARQQQQQIQNIAQSQQPQPSTPPRNSQSPIRSALRTGSSSPHRGQGGQQQQQDQYYISPTKNYPSIIDTLNVKIEVAQDRRRKDPVLFDQWNEQNLALNSLDPRSISLENLLSMVENVIFEGRNALNQGTEGILLVPGKLIAYRQSLYEVTPESSAPMRDIEELRGDDDAAGLFHKLSDYTFLDEIPLKNGDQIIWRDMYTIPASAGNDFSGLLNPYNTTNSSSSAIQQHQEQTKLYRSDRSRKIVFADEKFRDEENALERKQYFENHNEPAPALSVEEFTHREFVNRQREEEDRVWRESSQKNGVFTSSPRKADSPYVSPTRSPRNSDLLVGSRPPPTQTRNISPPRHSNNITDTFSNNNYTRGGLVSSPPSLLGASASRDRHAVPTSLSPQNLSSTRSVTGESAWIQSAYPITRNPYRDPMSEAEILAKRMEFYSQSGGRYF